MPINRLRWILLMISVPVGIGMCWIPWRIDTDHIAWGFPVPMVIWERIKSGWIDFPCPVAFILNPAIMVILSGLFFWWAGRRIRKTEQGGGRVR